MAIQALGGALLRAAGGSALRGKDSKGQALGVEFKTNAAQFRKALEKAAANIDAEVKDVVRLAALKIEQKAVEKTPVDTGRARASWNVSEEKVDGSVKPEGSYGVPPATPVGALSGEKVIYISNNLPYIVPLEYGHSSQAPKGMAALALAEVMAELRTLGEMG
jgi:hypothetical protein